MSSAIASAPESEAEVEAPARRSRWLPTGRTVFVSFTTASLIYLIIGPLLVLIFSSFRTGRNLLPFERAAEWTFLNYVDVFGSSATYSVMWNTFIYAAGALSLSFSLSIVLAWLVERTTIPFRSTIYIVVIASLGIPAVLNAISWGLLLNPRTGAINIFIRLFRPGLVEGPLDVYTMYGMIFVQGVTMVPITFLLITAAFRAMDSVLEEAALISGAPFATSVRRITVPILTPALLSALVYQLVTVVESFDIPLVIGLRGNIPVLSTRIFLEVRPALGLPN
jgi:iron(III) transport system permease protein